MHDRVLGCLTQPIGRHVEWRLGFSAHPILPAAGENYFI